MHEEDALAGFGALAGVASAAMNDGEVTNRELAIWGTTTVLWGGAKALRHGEEAEQY